MHFAESNALSGNAACTPADLTADEILDIKIDAATACLRICNHQVVEGITELQRLVGVLQSRRVHMNEYQDKALRVIYQLADDIDAVQIGAV